MPLNEIQRRVLLIILALLSIFSALLIYNELQEQRRAELSRKIQKEMQVETESSKLKEIPQGSQKRLFYSPSFPE